MSKQPIELAWQQSQPISSFFKTCLKTLSVKQPIETIKQLVVFPLLYKTLFFQKDFI